MILGALDGFNPCAMWTLPFLGALPFVRAVIGMVALGGGVYYLRGFFAGRERVCRVTASGQRQRVFQRLKGLAREPNFLLALSGILTLAFLVNLVELVCSAGIPAVYTQILAMHALAEWQYYDYLLLYIRVFMADDLVVFFTAMMTLRISGMATRYSRYLQLIGGAVLAAIGVLMLLRPEWLMFG